MWTQHHNPRPLVGQVRVATGRSLLLGLQSGARRAKLRNGHRTSWIAAYVCRDVDIEEEKVLMGNLQRQHPAPLWMPDPSFAAFNMPEGSIRYYLLGSTKSTPQSLTLPLRTSPIVLDSIICLTEIDQRKQKRRSGGISRGNRARDQTV
jgi:hypothetical protein